MIDRRTCTAYHEAGHAVAHERGGTGGGVSIVERHRTLGRAESEGYEDQSGARAHALSFYAGFAAELELGEAEDVARQGAESDFDRGAELRDLIGGTEGEWIAIARAFVRDNWRAVELIAAELLEHGSLHADEVALLMDIADGQATAADLAAFRSAFPGVLNSRST